MPTAALCIFLDVAAPVTGLIIGPLVLTLIAGTGGLLLFFIIRRRNKRKK